MGQKHGFSRNNNTPLTIDDLTAARRAAKVRRMEKFQGKYGARNMTTNCTAQTCPTLAELIERKEQAETQSRWRDAGDIWLLIQAHECAGGTK